MNLVQKLPIGLGLACLMFMSSCSKEDAVTPDSAVKNENSNLRQGGPVFVPGHNFPSTDGQTCIGCAPNNWQLKLPARDATSNLTAYAGNPSKKWVQQLPAPPTGSGSIITVVNDAIYAGEAFAKVKNLVKGKKYKLTFSVSTTSLKEVSGLSQYASKAFVRVYDGDYLATKNIDFNGKQNQWITETLEFEATDDVVNFGFSGFSSQGETKLTYANIHVGPNAVQMLN